MVDLQQFRDIIVIPTLQVLDLHSDAAVELLLGTAIQESRIMYLKQLGGGPALGFFQMEPATHADIWDNYLKYNRDLQVKVSLTASRDPDTRPPAILLASNLWYAAAMCRVHYWRRPEALPQAGDVEGMAAYWKEHYNTYLGAGTEEEYIENWEAYGIAVQG